MTFQLSDEANKYRLFLVKRSELEGRLDPSYFKLVNEFKYHVDTPFRKVGFLFDIKDGDHNKFPPEEIADSTNGVRYLRSQDLVEGKIICDAPVFVSKKYFDTIKRSHVKPGDILFSIMASVGSIAIVPPNFEVCTANRAVGILTRRSNAEIDPYYIQALFNTDYGQKLLNLLKKGGIQQRINLSDLSLLEIPVPPIQEQSKIASYLVNAYQKKQQKEAQAQQLFDSIDAYLLDVLGIKVNSNNQNSIENRIVKSSFRSVTGQRWDPLFHCGDMFSFVRKASPPIDLPQLNNLVMYFQTGFAAGRDDQGEKHSGIIQIRPTNINDNRELVFHRNVYIDASELNTRKSDVLNRDEVLFNNTNSQEQVGKTTYFDLEDDYFCSNHITRIATKADLLNPKYLCYILNLYQNQKCFFKLCTNWNNQSGVGIDVLQKIPIPLPTLDKQNKIADHIQTIRDQAKQLRAEAAAGLEQAKQEVEAMILGKETAQ